MSQSARHIWSVLMCLFVLAGCGGSGGSGGTTPDPSPDPTVDPLLPYIDYAQMDEDLQAQHQGLAYTADANLPATGSAKYTGVMRLITELHAQPAQLAGSLSMNVDFGGGSVSGSANGFKDDLNNAFSGKLVISNGIIDRDADPDWEYRFFADIDGTLDGAGTDLVISADLYGDFHGPQGESIAGGLAGRPSGQAVGDYLYGTFAAAK